jgi:hypothetical protein
MYFEDLTPYEYLSENAALVNVGWLDGSHPFVTGTLANSERDALVELARESQNLTRGYHYCELCDADSPIRVHRSDGSGMEVRLGNGEIHVPGDGVVYSAPTMVIHYIDQHSYLPPEQFRRALRSQ